MRRPILLSFSVLILFGVFSRALASPCSDALVQDVYKSDSKIKNDYRLAEFVDETTWNTASTSAGASGTLFGVPVGASFANYKASASAYVKNLGVEISQSDAESIFHSALNPTSATLYSQCLASLTNGLFAWIDSADSAPQVTVHVKWSVPGGQPLNGITFVPSAAPGSTVYPATIPNGGTASITFDRPDKPFVFTVSGNGYASEPLTIGPLVDALQGCSGSHAAMQQEDTFDEFDCTADFKGRMPILTIRNFIFDANVDKPQLSYVFRIKKNGAALINPGVYSGPITAAKPVPDQQGTSPNAIAFTPVPIVVYVGNCRDRTNNSTHSAKDGSPVICHYSFDYSLY